MATVTNKDFKIKSGLIVEGTTGTINGYDILTKKTADQNYIIGLIGGAATSENTADTVVLRDENGDFSAGIITAETRFSGDLTGNVTGTVSDISNHDTDDLTEGTNNLYFSESRAQVGVSNALGSGLGYGSEGAGNVFYVDTNVIATKQFATDEANGALAAAEDYAELKATDAQNAAQSYAEGLVQQEASDRDTAISTAITNLDLANTYDAKGAAAQALADAEDYADGLINDGSNSSTEIWSAYKTNTEIGLAEDRAKQHADDEIAALVGSAPALLDTLQELAAAIDNDPETINNLQSLAAGKQNALTEGANIDITNDVISVTGLASTDISDFNTAALSATASAYDAAGSADTAEDNAIAAAALDATDKADAAEAAAIAAAALDATSKADAAEDNAIAAAALDATSKANTAEQNAKDYADALDTDDVSEGSTNLYFTDARAKASAGNLLAGATKENVEITYVNGVLSITAENGVADSDTDDLDEGVDNLYFTDQRAIDALQNTTPTFSAVDIDSIAKQVAGTTVVPVAGIATAYSWLKADYRSAEFLVKVANGDHTEVSKVLITLHANDNISMTEYGIVGTNGSLGSVTAAISGNDVQLQVTTANNTSTVTVVGTLLV